MTMVSKDKGTLKVNAYVGDAKTLLAFNLAKGSTKNLAGFTVQVQPGNKPPYYLLNELQYEKPSDHAQDRQVTAELDLQRAHPQVPVAARAGFGASRPKPCLRRLHLHRHAAILRRSGSLQPIDPKLSVAVDVPTSSPFAKKGLSLGFTRGFTQSQAFVHHFGLEGAIQPPKSAPALRHLGRGRYEHPRAIVHLRPTNTQWLGFTAQDRIFDILDEVVANKTLRLDVFAYDLNEPDVVDVLLKLARQGRVRIILDNASLHHDRQEGPRPRISSRPCSRRPRNEGARSCAATSNATRTTRCFIVSNKTGPAEGADRLDELLRHRHLRQLQSRRGVQRPRRRQGYPDVFESRGTTT